MPQLDALDGWTAWRALEAITSTRGIVRDVPAAGLRWCYLIEQELPPGLYHYGMSYRIERPDGQSVLEGELILPIHVIPEISTWYVQNERVVTSYPEDARTWGDQAEQPTILTNNAGYTPVSCEVYSAGYLVRIPAGAIWVVEFHDAGAPGLTRQPLWTSVLAAPQEKIMLVDPVTNDQHLPRLVDDMLVLRSQTPQGLTGVQEGLGISVASGTLTVAAGTAIVDYLSYRLPAAVVLAVSGTRYVYAEPAASGADVLEVALYESPQPSRRGICLGRVTASRATACQGVLVAAGVSSYALGRQEDGTLVMRYDTDDEDDLEARSRDRGVTWQ